MASNGTKLTDVHSTVWATKLLYARVYRAAEGSSMVMPQILFPSVKQV